MEGILTLFDMNSFCLDLGRCVDKNRAWLMLTSSQGRSHRIRCGTRFEDSQCIISCTEYILITAILVRDEIAREKLRQEAGPKGIIM